MMPVTQDFTASLPFELASQATLLALPHLQALQIATSMAQAAVASLLVEVGVYSVSFTKQAQAATALALHAWAEGESVLPVSALHRLNCQVKLRTEVELVDGGYGGFTYIHAFADGRYRATLRTRTPKAPPVFLLVQGGVPGGKRSKSSDAERLVFLQLFSSSSTSHRSGRGDWEEFAKWVQTPSLNRASGTGMSDAWLLSNICDHEWLGNIWRVSEDGTLNLVSGDFHIPLGRVLSMKPNMSIAVSGGSAAPFTTPSWPEDALVVLTEELMRAVGPAWQFLKNAGVPSEFISADPLALDYPPVFDTRTIP
jgi:hypothetical protein